MLGLTNAIELAGRIGAESLPDSGKISAAQALWGRDSAP